MNKKTPNPKERLLQDVLGNASDAELNALLKQRALAQFRRARFRRRMTRLAQLAAAIAAVLAISYSFSRTHLPRQSEIASQGTKALVTNAVSENPSLKPSSSLDTQNGEIPIINDQELLALFPKDSCILAEVDGKKVLVFHDPNLRKQYLYEPGVQ